MEGALQMFSMKTQYASQVTLIAIEYLTRKSDFKRNPKHEKKKGTCVNRAVASPGVPDLSLKSEHFYLQIMKSILTV